MFRKNETESVPEPIRSYSRNEPSKAGGGGEKSTIGISLHIKGEIDGAEDLMIEGIVEGLISLNQNTVVVGKSGRVQADIRAKVITVDGQVTGNLFGADQVIVHASGLVIGNIKAPRVSLDDGARIKGAIDTDPIPATTNLSSPQKEGPSSLLPDRKEESDINEHVHGDAHVQ